MKFEVLFTGELSWNSIILYSYVNLNGVLYQLTGEICPVAPAGDNFQILTLPGEILKKIDLPGEIFEKSWPARWRFEQYLTCPV